RLICVNNELFGSFDDPLAQLFHIGATAHSDICRTFRDRSPRSVLFLLMRKIVRAVANPPLPFYLFHAKAMLKAVAGWLVLVILLIKPAVHADRMGNVKTGKRFFCFCPESIDFIVPLKERGTRLLCALSECHGTPPF